MTDKDVGPFHFVTRKKMLDGTVTNGKVTRKFESMELAREALYNATIMVGSTKGMELKRTDPENIVFADMATGTVTSIVIVFEPSVDTFPIMTGA